MIEVKNSCIRIHNYQLGDVPNLEKSLGIWDKAVFQYTWVAFVYDEDNEILTIPGGYNLKALEKFFPDKKVEFNLEGDEAKTAIFKTITQPRDDEQKASIDYLLGRGKFEEYQDFTQKMLCLKTGGGKTYCTINYLSKVRERAMVIVDQEKLLNQWKDSFLQHTNLNEKEIYVISGAASIKKLLKEAKDVHYKMYIASHRTIASFAGDDWSKVTELFKKLCIGVKVIDEAHVEFKNTFMIDAHTNVRNTVYLTATPGRSNPVEDGLYTKMFKMIPKYGLSKKFEQNYHIITYISYNSNPTTKEEARCSTRRGFDVNQFCDYTFHNDDNYDMLFNIVNKIIKTALQKDGKLAIILHKNDNVQQMKDHLDTLYPDVEIGTFCGLIKNTKERQKELDKKIILSTDKSLGKAIDIPDLRYVIMTVPTSSKIVSEQVLGRLRRIEGANVFYFDITDVGFKACRNQRRLRRQILDKKAIKIRTLDC